MFKSNKLAILAALLSLLMLFSAFAIPAFAEDATTAEETTVEETTVEETTVAETVEETTAESTESESASETTAATTTAATTTKKEETTTENKAEAEAKKQQRTRGIINLCVGVVLLIALAALIFAYRGKIPSWWKGLKSECGKITWCPKEKLRKNTFVVVIIILAIAVAIGVLDFVFSRGMILLGDLAHKWFH